MSISPPEGQNMTAGAFGITPPSAHQIHDLLLARNFDRAKPYIDQRLSAQPNDPEAHYLLGVFHFFQNRLGLAIDSLKRCLNLDPRHTDAAICLSVLLNDIGRYDEAKRVFEIANHSVSFQQLGDDAEVDRKFAVKHLELADLYFRYRRWDEAIEEYAKSAALDPTALEIRIRLAKAYAKKGYATRAISELEQLKLEHPRFVTARIQLGLLHYSQGKPLDAELEWESALQIEPDHREALAYREMLRTGSSVTSGDF